MPQNRRLEGRTSKGWTVTEHAVLIVGGGPTGLMLAAELALAGVDAAIVERRATPDLPGSRAGGLHARTIEVLDQRGIADRFLAEGQVAQVAGFARVSFDISDFPTRHPYGLGLWQNHIERLLAGWVEELAVTIYRDREATGFAQDDTGVDVELSDGRSLRADYLVGCDGGRSLVRKEAGIDFPGWDPTTSALIAEVEMAEEPELGMRQDAVGVHGIGRVEYEIRDGEIVYADHGPVRVMVTDQNVGSTGEPTLHDVSEALISIYGTDFGVHSPIWISRFSDMTRQAAAYRKGRVLLAGDAAHVHSPVGGQGLNTGVQDALNLGWKLAQVVEGTSPDSLLDSYHDERHPVAARVLRNTMSQVALTRPGDARLDALRDTVADLLSMEEPRTRYAAMMSGLDIHYDLGEGHPLLGRRMPDLDLVTAEGARRVFTLLHEARPVLLNLGPPGGLGITPWADRVRLVDADFGGTWELPVLGGVAAPAAVLIRPDGYVAWVGDGTDAGLEDALTRWFGPPAQARISTASG
jgi:2-polyprenyl-6-methoxyphenol hydroxylase-like FAD-dependent oxidoreductase